MHNRYKPMKSKGSPFSFVASPGRKFQAASNWGRSCEWKVCKKGEALTSLKAVYWFLWVVYDSTTLPQCMWSIKIWSLCLFFVLLWRSEIDLHFHLHEKVAKVLTPRKSHLAIVAKPGSGKSCFWVLSLNFVMRQLVKAVFLSIN